MSSAINRDAPSGLPDYVSSFIRTINPDGIRAYVTQEAAQINVIDLTTMTSVSVSNTLSGPIAAPIAPIDSASSAAQTVAQSASSLASESIPAAQAHVSSAAPSALPDFVTPFILRATPDGRSAYVTEGAAQLNIIDLTQLDSVDDLYMDT